MDAIRTVYTFTLMAIVALIGTSFVSCSTPPAPRSEEVRKHTNESFDRLSAEEQAKKRQSGYSQ